MSADPVQLKVCAMSRPRPSYDDHSGTVPSGFLTIVTQVKAHAIRDDIPLKALTVAIPGEGVMPEEVFKAANRIGDQEDDIGDLWHPWQKEVRRLLDEKQMASMSVGDMMLLSDMNGKVFSVMCCEAFGWSDVDVHAAIDALRDAL